MKKLAVFFIGIVVAFVGIWGGAFLCSIFPRGESAYDFAAFITGLVVFVFGVAIAVYGAFNNKF